MKNSAIAASAIVALLVLGGATVAFAHAGLGAGSSSTLSTHSETGDQNEQGQNDHGEGGHLNLAVGQSITFTNLNGTWVAFSHGDKTGDDSDDSSDSAFHTQSGNATGSFTFKVINLVGDSFILSMTSGSFKVNGTTHTISKGEAILNPGGESGFGNGTASGGSTFDIHIAGLHGNLTSSAQVGAIRLDVTSGKSTYLVILGSHEGVGEDMGED